MILTSRRYGVLAALASVLVLSLAPVRAEAAVPQPVDDPFYAVAGHLAGLRNGAIVASRGIAAYAGAVPLPARAWQVKYKTLDEHGRPTTTLATVVVPKAPWHGPGRRPVVSYQVAEDGIGLRCTPSYTIRAGLAEGATVAQAELSYALPLLLSRGWAVVVPDWEGPRSEFAVRAMAAHAILDGIRAALHFRPAGLSGRRPVALWGYSGGGFATTVAAQAQPRYAPDLHLRAVAAGGVPGDVRSVWNALHAGPFGGATTIILTAYTRAFPGARLAAAEDAALRRYAARNNAACLIDGTVSGPFFDPQDHLSAAGMSRFRALMWANSPLASRGVPSAPMFMYQARVDELVPAATARALAAKLCAGGAHLRFSVFPGGEHAVEEVVGGLQAISYLAGRFAGRPAPTTCK